MKVAYCETCVDIVEVFQDDTELGGRYFCPECGSTIDEKEVEEENELSG